MAVKDRKRRVLTAVAAYRHATRRLRTLLDEVDAGLEVFVSLVEEDVSMAELLLGTDASARRREFAEAMDAFETTRRRLRIAVLQLGSERGESITAMAKALGISRQLAHRLMAEGR